MKIRNSIKGRSKIESNAGKTGIECKFIDANGLYMSLIPNEPDK